MKKLVLSLAVSAMVLGGCASQPEDIHATYVSPNTYAKYTCEEMEIELQDVTSQVMTLTGQLESKANADAAQMGVGLFLFWPTLFLLDGDGVQAAQYANLKGQHEAINKMYKRKKCQSYVEAG